MIAVIIITGPADRPFAGTLQYAEAKMDEKNTLRPNIYSHILLVNHNLSS